MSGGVPPKYTRGEERFVLRLSAVSGVIAAASFPSWDGGLETPAKFAAGYLSGLCLGYVLLWLREAFWMNSLFHGVVMGVWFYLWILATRFVFEQLRELSAWLWT